MIEQIIGATIVPVLQNLDWTDQIAWVAKPWINRIESKESEWSDRIIPVAKNVTVEGCLENADFLKILGTDAAYRSLILISLEGDMTSEIASNIAKRRAVNIDQDISINVWLNDHQGTSHIAQMELMSALYRYTVKNLAIDYVRTGLTANTDYTMYINKLRVTFLREIQGNPFSDYAFSSDQAQFNNKYAAFGMVFKLTGLVFPACKPAYPELGCTATISTITTTVCSGAEMLILSDVDGGQGEVSYQWQRRISGTWTDIAGANAATYTTSAMTGAEGSSFYYRLKVKHDCNRQCISNMLTFVLSDDTLVYITADPLTVSDGGTSYFTSEVIGGAGGNSYQWQALNDVGVWINQDDGNGPNFYTPRLYTGTQHIFRLVVTQAAGCETISAQVVITVA